MDELVTIVEVTAEELAVVFGEQMATTTEMTEKIIDTLMSRPKLFTDSESVWKVGDKLGFFCALSVGHPVDVEGCPNEDEDELKLSVVVTAVPRVFDIIADKFYIVRGDTSGISESDNKVMPFFIHKELPQEEINAIRSYLNLIANEKESLTEAKA